MNILTEHDLAQWAAGAIRRKPTLADYAGLSYQQASRRALAICDAAAKSQVTQFAHLYLTQFAATMRVEARHTP